MQIKTDKSVRKHKRNNFASKCIKTHSTKKHCRYIKNEKMKTYLVALKSLSEETSRLVRLISFWCTSFWSPIWGFPSKASRFSCSISSVSGARSWCKSWIVPCATMDELSASTGCKGEAMSSDSGWNDDGFSECKAADSTTKRTTSVKERSLVAVEEEKRGQWGRPCISVTHCWDMEDMDLPLAKCRCRCKLLVSATLFTISLLFFFSFTHWEWVRLYGRKFTKE